MKYQVGDLLLIKDCKYRFRPLLRALLLLLLRPHPELFNSFGIVTQAIKHNDTLESETTSDDNVYIWFSQIDGKEYFFFEDEVTGEVIDEI